MAEEGSREQEVPVVRAEVPELHDRAVPKPAEWLRLRSLLRRAHRAGLTTGRWLVGWYRVGRVGVLRKMLFRSDLVKNYEFQIQISNFANKISVILD